MWLWQGQTSVNVKTPSITHWTQLKQRENSVHSLANRSLWLMICWESVHILSAQILSLLSSLEEDAPNPSRASRVNPKIELLAYYSMSICLPPRSTGHYMWHQILRESLGSNDLFLFMKVIFRDFGRRKLPSAHDRVFKNGLHTNTWWSRSTSLLLFWIELGQINLPPPHAPTFLIPSGVLFLAFRE